MKTRILLMFLCMLAGIQMRAADGDSFTATTAEGIEMTFVVTSEENLTAKVGDGTNTAVDVATSGTLTIPASVEYGDNIYSVITVSANAFKGCTSLENVNIEEGITSLGTSAFQGCTSVVYITLPQTLKSLGTNVFDSCSALSSIEIPGGITTIPTNAFANCSSLKTAILNEGIKSIASYGFSRCSSLKDVSLPSSLTGLGQAAFSRTGLETIELPENISSIGTYVFFYTQSLKKIILRMPSPIKFGSNTFTNISNNCSLHVPEGTKDAYKAAGWTSSIFKAGIVEGDDTPVLGDSFKAITDEGVELTYVVRDVDNWNVTVGNGTSTAVDANIIAEKITIPSTVSLGELTYNVTAVGAKAFMNCTVIKEVEIPSSLVSIGAQAFNGCTGLKAVYARMETPFTFGTNAFSNISNYCGLHVPEGTKVDYLEAGWTKDIFKGGVVEGDDALTGGFKFTQANADGVEITYVIVDIDEKTVQVGDDTEQAVSTETSGSITIPEIVDYDGMTYSVATIGNNAFAGIAGVTDVNLPEALKNIGANALKDCTGLTTVTIPASVTSIGTNAFGGCTNLTKVINRNTAPFTLTANSFAGINDRCGLHVPEGLKSSYLEAGWTDKVFKGGVVEGDNTLLKGDTFTVADENGVDIIYVVTDPDNKIVKVGNGMDKAIAPETKGKVSVPSEVTYDEVNYSVNSISANAFKGCEGISNIEIGEGIVSIGKNAFQSCIGLKSLTMPDNMVSIGEFLCEGCTSLDSITISNGITIIPLNAFDNCSSLKKVTLPDGVTTINSYGFRNCTSLETIELPASLRGLGQSAFGMSGLKSIVLPEDFRTLGSYAFYKCSSLESIYLPNNIQSIGDFALGFTAITSITIPESLTKLPNYLLADCYYLKEVHLPSTLTNIPREMFRHNLSLESIEIPEGVTSIAYFAFYDCPKLTEVTLPSTLTSAELRAFYYCAGLKKVIARMENPFQMPTEMFGECTSSIALHIPEGTHDKYVEAGWISDIFPGGIVYGDDTPTLNEVFTFTTIEGVEVTAVLTDIEKKTIQVGQGTSGNPAIDQATQGIVTLPDTVEAFGQKYVITTIGGYAFRYCNDVTEVKIPATVTHIGRYGFGNMDNLEKAVLPDSLIAMETAAFYRDAKLSELKLNEGLQDIGNYSFSYAAISELEIPKSVTNIGRNSFAACEQLDKVISRIEAAYAFQDGAFVQISSTCGLHVPEGTKEAYIEQGWTEETFPGGIVYGDETLHKGQSFDVTEEDGTQKTFRVTDVNEMKAEMVSVKAGSEAGGTVTLMPTATHELTGNVYTVSSIADKAFGADVKKVLSRIETPFAVSSAAFASLSPMCSLHVPAGTKAAYLEQGWTEESFKAGVVEGDDTLVKGQTFTLTDEDGTSTTYRVTDVNDNLVEIVSAKEGEETDGRVSILQAVTDPVAGNDYTVGSIGNGAFKEELKAVSAEAETPYPVTPEAFKGIGDKCVLFVPAGTKDAYVENGWTEDIFKGGIYEGNIPGDVNEDLAVDISDIVAVINTIADPENSTYRYADVNEDEKVDISDIVKIINIIAEK